MGELIKTPYSEVTATLEVLDRHGVTSESLTELRSNANLAKKVAGVMLGNTKSPKVGFRVRLGSAGVAYAEAFLKERFDFQTVDFSPDMSIYDEEIEKAVSRSRVPARLEDVSLPFGMRVLRIRFKIPSSPLSALQSLIALADLLGLELKEIEFTEAGNSN